MSGAHRVNEIELLCQTLPQRRPTADRLLHAINITSTRAAFVRSILKQSDCALPAIRTDAHNRAAARRQGGQFLDGLAQDPGAGGGERMTERNASAIRVDALAWELPERMLDTGLRLDERRIFQRLDVTSHLGGKRLVNFPQVNI